MEKRISIITIVILLLSAFSVLLIPPLNVHAQVTQPLGSLTISKIGLPQGTLEVPTNVTATYLGFSLDSASTITSNGNITIQVTETVEWTVSSSASGTPLISPDWGNYTPTLGANIKLIDVKANGSSTTAYVFDSATGKIQVNLTAVGLTSAGAYVDIDYIYQFNLTVSNWVTKQLNQTVIVGEPKSYSIDYQTTFTTKLPVSGVNITLSYTPPDANKLINQVVAVDGASVTPTITNGVIEYGILNALSNDSSIKYTAKDILNVTYPCIRKYIGYFTYNGYIKKKYQTTVLIQNTYSELIAENIILMLIDYQSTSVAEVNPECEIEFSKLLLNGSDVTPNLINKTPYNYTAPATNINPSNTLNYTLIQVLPPVYLIDTNGCIIKNMYFMGGMNYMKFQAEATGVRKIKIHISTTPYGVYVDHVKYSNYTFDSNTQTLVITYDFHSTHLFEIYQYKPPTGGVSGVATTTEKHPAPTPKPTPQQWIPIAITLAVIILLAILIINYFTCIFFNKLCRRR